jgi:hypothetical protein
MSPLKLCYCKGCYRRKIFRVFKYSIIHSLHRQNPQAFSSTSSCIFGVYCYLRLFVFHHSVCFILNRMTASFNIKFRQKSRQKPGLVFRQPQRSSYIFLWLPWSKATVILYDTASAQLQLKHGCRRKCQNISSGRYVYTLALYSFVRFAVAFTREDAFSGFKRAFDSLEHMQANSQTQQCNVYEYCF